tara:strand:+ start:6781 stop:7632 length:852 start_codon:yes stop_codon:yes gene_type:complete
MLVVAALGANALLQRGQPLTAEAQRVNVTVAAKALAGIIRAGHRLVITHGNGPQVGLLALQGAAYKPDEAYPLNVLGAETAGMIGYMIEQELENALGHDRAVATLLTQVVVDPRDPGFANPTKPVGPVYARAEAEALAKARDWRISPDGDNWRRVVICTGGGGIPVIRHANGSLIGIEAVVDKDASSALLARSLKADALLLLTDVDAVYRDFGEPNATRISQVTPEEALKLDAAEGSMAPKLRAAAEFASGGGVAAIGRLADALLLLDGKVGTKIAAGQITAT